jgi:hypothetical protein
MMNSFYSENDKTTQDTYIRYRVCVVGLKLKYFDMTRATCDLAGRQCEWVSLSQSPASKDVSTDLEQPPLLDAITKQRLVETWKT